MVRLQKFLADAGVASRRASEALILAGRIKVNGRVVQVLGSRVNPEQDAVTVDGKPARLKRKLYVALNKPRRYVCSRKDEKGRDTVYDLLPREWSNVFTVGRLDYDSEGLILLTNDGEFSLHLTHPRYGVAKKYLATVEGRVNEDAARQLGRGVLEAGEWLRARAVRVHHSGPSGSLVEIELTEGKNREVRRMFGALGLAVKRLKRIQIGRLKLGELRPGRWRTLTDGEIKTLLTKI
ncbi:MAG: rRNA pseudouridine synthase [Verrucomicrobia bacterium]|nr:rRNA pseudouridine synthase [Verrucomicrobiota bacterium]